MRPLGLGDFLTAVPAYRALARAFPAHRRVLAAPAALASLVPLLGGSFDELVPTEPLTPLSGALRHADVAVDLHGRGPASQRILLAASPRRLVAFANDDVPETHGSAAWRPDEHEVARWCRMLGEAGIAADPGELDLEPPDVPGPAFAAGATIVHAGAASASRRWPVERFVDVVRSERDAGRTVVVTGGPADVPRGAEIAAGAGLAPHCDLTGRTSLAQLAALVAAAGRVLATDTGMAHLATAYRVPSVVLFGPTSPRTWGPPPERPQHRVLWRGRLGDPHGATLDPGLARITSRQVIAALRGLD